MEVIKYLKQIYQGNNALANHITLFSLLGIMVILLNNIAAYFGSGLVYLNFLAIPPASKLELSLNLFFAILILIYFFGYEYKFINENFHNESIKLPEFDLMPSVMVLRILPMFLLWQVYYIFALAVGSFALLSFGNMALSYVVYSLFICIQPFIHLIMITFAYDFKFNKALANPFTLFNYLDKSLGDVIFLFLETCLVSIIPVVLVGGIIFLGHKIVSEPYRLSFYLLGLCVGMYFINILKYIYIAGLMNIVKEKFLVNRV